MNATHSDHPCKRLRLDILALESAFESSAGQPAWLDDERISAFLDRETGEVVFPEPAEEDFDVDDERWIEIPTDAGGLSYQDLEEFVASLDDTSRQTDLGKVIHGRGAFRRFKDYMYNSGDIELRHAWRWFETRKLRERIVAWLAQAGIEAEWGCDIFAPPALPDPRPALLAAVLEFVGRANRLKGIRRIALIGSLATVKAQPKDVDLLVVVEDSLQLEALAKMKRQLAGKIMQSDESRGTDVFLANPSGEYLGRICHWKECRPGIRMSCQALHCGRRNFLCDDLQVVKLNLQRATRQSLELWPHPGPGDSATQVPADVVRLLLAPLGWNG